MAPAALHHLAIFDLSGTHLIIILIIALLLFGSKLPSIMRSLGRSANEFKAGMNDPAAPAPPPAAPPAGQVSRDGGTPQQPGKN